MDFKKIIKKGRPLIMGVLNVTPDSFSDGGQYYTLQKAVKRAKEMELQGADIIDIGGESTGPDSKYVSPEEELKRIIPVLKKLRKQTKLPISIDTYKSEVAKQALEEGADIINDVTALREDPALAEVIAKYKCPIIVMFSKDNTPRTVVKKKQYKDIIKTIKDFLQKRIQFAKKQGIKKELIIIDPGMGNYISKIPKYSCEIITRLQELKSLNCPILIGASRKSFIGGTFEERDIKGVLLAGIAYLNRASIIRTHNVKGTREFFDTFNG